MKTKTIHPNSLANLKPRQKGDPAPAGGGRPAGLAALVRSRTDNGRTILEGMLSIADGTLIIDGQEPRHQDRLRANEWLADRGFGKAVETIIGLDGAQAERLDLAREVARQLLRSSSHHAQAVDVETVKPAQTGQGRQAQPQREEAHAGEGGRPPEGVVSHDNPPKL